MNSICRNRNVVRFVLLYELISRKIRVIALYRMQFNISLLIHINPSFYDELKRSTPYIISK